ncbi:MAG: hypothetical protein U0Q15_14440 [Kineosporiaceae bacterium]
MLPAGELPVTAAHAPARAGGTDEDVVAAWIDAAEAFDRFDLALRLRARPRVTAAVAGSLDLVALERELTVTRDDDPAHPLGLDDLFGSLRGPGGARTAVDIAAALLLTGRLPDAVNVLRLAGLWQPGSLDARASGSRARMVLAACRAACGDADAYARLLTGDAGSPVLTGYLQAAAAAVRGDLDVADQAWERVVEQGAPLTDHSFPPWAAAVVAHRSRVDPEAAAAAVLAAARGVASLAHDPLRHPAPVLAALEALTARGDHPGARLLALAVHRRHPELPLTAHLGAALPWWRRLPGLGVVDARVARRLRRGTASRGHALPGLLASRRSRGQESVAALDRADQLSRCVCLRSHVLVDDDAVAYAQHHLRPAELGADAVSVLRGVGSGAWLGSCPLTGIQWLGVDVAPGQPAWLARGVVPRTRAS